MGCRCRRCILQTDREIVRDTWRKGGTLRTVERIVFDVGVVVEPVDARDGEGGAGGAVERCDGTSAVVGRLIDEKVEGAGGRARVEGVDHFEAPVEVEGVGQEQVIGRRDVARSSA